MSEGWAILLPVLLLATGSVAAGVTVEIGRDADLSGYSTYAWEAGTPSADDRAGKWIVDAVDAQLEQAGLTRVDGDADLLIATIVIAESVTGTTVDPGYWGGGSEFGVPTVDIADYRKGTLYVTLTDRLTDQVVWRASGTASVRGGQSHKYQRKITSVVQKIFRKFPRKAR
jgi:hypothetical protein